jgi:hypothetical protein
MTKKEMLVLQGTDPLCLTGAQLSCLTGAELSCLTGAQLSCLTREQLSCLTREQLSCLTRAQLSWLTDAQLSWLTGEQLSCLTGAQLSCLTRAQEAVPILKNPYSALLKAIKAEGCSLNMKTWHTCETTHCLGGWVVVLAKAQALEKTFETEGAARLILRKSRPEAPLPNFYAKDDAAMEFIEARAAEEKE